MIKLWQGVAMRTDRDSQAGSIPACHIVQFNDRTQLAMTPSDTGRASSNRRINFVASIIGSESRRLRCTS